MFAVVNAILPAIMLLVLAACLMVAGALWRDMAATDYPEV